MMLRLPAKWRVIHGGAAVQHMLGQLPTLRLKAAFEKHLMSAALDQFADACRRRSGTVLRIVPRRNLRWQINDCTYKLLPTVDDAAIYECEQIANEIHRYTFIVPPDQDSVLKYALEGLVGKKYPTVFSISTFISWRMTFDSHDFGQDPRQTFIDFINRYNNRVRNLCIAEQLLIKLPRALEK